ncbi:MAG TPA: YigZ family protein [Anaerolineales bacterium]|nr:YigZ family protein [Anaerolineales bacterium]
MESYRIPAGPARQEIEVLNSHFIASAAPAFSVEDARQFISQIKDEFKDATHNVPAFVIGSGASTISHCHDDGEPSGTAGRPALAVLSGSGYGDIVVVVTRYFGGTKLGTGGLVRAYSDAVRAVLAEITPAEKVLTHTVMLAFPYNWFERAKLLVTENQGEILDKTFAEDVTLTVRFRHSHLPGFQQALSESSHATLQALVIESGINIIKLD